MFALWCVMAYPVFTMYFLILQEYVYVCVWQSNCGVSHENYSQG